MGLSTDLQWITKRIDPEKIHCRSMIAPHASSASGLANSLTVGTKQSPNAAVRVRTTCAPLTWTNLAVAAAYRPFAFCASLITIAQNSNQPQNYDAGRRRWKLSEKRARRQKSQRPSLVHDTVGQDRRLALIVGAKNCITVVAAQVHANCADLN